MKEIDIYNIKKTTINKNLYGVDKEISAIEITKLRLWLSLIEDLSITNRSQIDTLPNIEYNIIAGNSLIGWFNEKIVQSMAVSPYDDRVDGIFTGLELAYHDNDNKYALLCESKELLSRDDVKVENLKKAYSILKILYSQEDSSRSVKLREILEI